jgi:hypothetical protein
MLTLLLFMIILWRHYQKDQRNPSPTQWLQISTSMNSPPTDEQILLAIHDQIYSLPFFYSTIPAVMRGWGIWLVTAAAISGEAWFVILGSVGSGINVESMGGNIISYCG